MTTELVNIEDAITELRKKFGAMKVNLCEQNSGSNGEGCWGVPSTEKDEKIYKDESKKGEKFNVRLLNRSVYWPNGDWGSEVLAINGGGDRAYAYPEDNVSLVGDDYEGLQ